LGVSQLNSDDNGSLTSSGALTAAGGALYVHLRGGWSSSGPLTASGGGTLGFYYGGSNSGAVTATSAAVYFTGTWSNSGPIKATASTLDFYDSWSNSGVATLSASTLNLRGPGVWTAATLAADAASSVNFNNSFSTQGGTLRLSGGAGWNLNGLTLSNSTLVLDPGATLHVNAPSTLDGVTLSGNLDVTHVDGLSVVHGLTLNGTASVGAADGSSYGRIYFDGTQTLAGTGTILFGAHQYNALIRESRIGVILWSALWKPLSTTRRFVWKLGS
jgi:hypothetical protein